MFERIPEMAGRQLDRPAYHQDFAAEFAQLTGVLWKLERGQTYQERGDPSWEAFVAGDWEQSLVLNEQELNTRPRACLGFYTPQEVFHQMLLDGQSTNGEGVASTN